MKKQFLSEKPIEALARPERRKNGPRGETLERMKQSVLLLLMFGMTFAVASFIWTY